MINPSVAEPSSPTAVPMTKDQRNHLKGAVASLTMVERRLSNAFPSWGADVAGSAIMDALAAAKHVIERQLAA